MKLSKKETYMSQQDNINNAQGTEEWKKSRLGKVTASKINDVLAWTSRGESVTRARYRAQLANERITGEQISIPQNHHMERGVTFEPVARKKYEARTGNVVKEVGFYDHPTIPMCGASPDGTVGNDGLIEIKCPTEINHLATVVNAEVPPRYYGQIQWQLACTNRLWCDFVSYSPDAPNHLALYVLRVHRDNIWIQETETEVLKFLAEVDLLTQNLIEVSNVHLKDENNECIK